jgi:CBS domain-containing protein
MERRVPPVFHRFDGENALMKKNDPVTHVMTRELVTLEVHEALSKARALFEESAIHHLPVTRGGDLAGILSWTDFLRISFGEFGNQDGRGLDAMLDHTYKLADVMQSNPTTLQVTGTVRDAAQILSTGKFHSLPIVDGTKLVGLVTSSDLIRYLLDQY